MLVLDRNGSIVCRGNEQRAPQPRRGYAQLAAYPEGDLARRIRRLIELAFDQLGLHSLELHVREDDAACQELLYVDDEWINGREEHNAVEYVI